MTMLDNNKRHAKRVANLIAANRSQHTGTFAGIWSWVNGVASGIGHFLGGPITSAIRALYAAVKDVVDAYREMIDAIWRGELWLELYVIRRVEQYVNHQFARLRAAERRDFKYLIRLLYVVASTVLTLAYQSVARERQARIRAVSRAEAYTRMRVRALHSTIEREAESGYRIERNQRVAVIARLLDYAVLRDPLLKDLVSVIVTGILDLLTVEDPPARLLLGFLIRKVIDRLGVDKAVGHLADELMRPLLGERKPDNLHNVIEDISARLAAGERQWVTLMENGGAQIEQAGRDWRDITGVLGNTAIVAFVGQAIVNPNGWAKEIHGTIGVAANDVIAAATKLFREG